MRGVTVLVTGGAGFIGRHLVAALLAAGADVRVLDIAPWPDAPAGVDLVAGSVTDLAAVQRAVAGADAVAHLAAQAEIWSSDRADHHRINVEGSAAVAAAAARARVRRFLNVSSATTLVAGARAPATVDERADPPVAALLGRYPRSKRLGEAAVLAAAAGTAMEVVSALPTLPLGPTDADPTAPNRLVGGLATGTTPMILESWMDLVDVRDLAATLAAALDRGRAGHRYLVAGHGLWLSDLALAVDRAAGRVPRRRPRVPYPLAWAAALAGSGIATLTGARPAAPITGVRLAGRVRRFDDARARAELGHGARPLADTLGDMLAAPVAAATPESWRSRQDSNLRPAV